MNTKAIIVAVFPTVMIVGAILAPVLSRRRSVSFRDLPAPEGDGSEDFGRGNHWVPVEANESEPDREQPTDQTVDSGQEDQYHEDWMTLQERFVN